MILDQCVTKPIHFLLPARIKKPTILPRKPDKSAVLALLPTIRNTPSDTRCKARISDVEANLGHNRAAHDRMDHDSVLAAFYD